MTRRITHVIGFDDAPFAHDHRSDVLVVGAVYSGLRIEGVISGKVRRDGVNATKTLTNLVSRSRFKSHTQLILLQGIAFAGFNVIDIHGLHEVLRIPVVVCVRKRPNLRAIRCALLENVPGGKRKWTLIERAGPMEPANSVYVQRVGVSLEKVCALLKHLAVHGVMPEPLRTAHIIAGGVTLGESRHRV